MCSDAIYSCRAECWTVHPSVNHYPGAERVCTTVVTFRVYVHAVEFFHGLLGFIFWRCEMLTRWQHAYGSIVDTDTRFSTFYAECGRGVASSTSLLPARWRRYVVCLTDRYLVQKSVLLVYVNCQTHRFPQNVACAYYLFFELTSFSRTMPN